MSDTKVRKLSSDMYPIFSECIEKLQDAGVEYVLQLDILDGEKPFSWRGGSSSIFGSKQLSIDEMSDGSIRAIKTSNTVFPLDARARPGDACVIQRKVEVEVLDSKTIPEILYGEK